MRKTIISRPASSRKQRGVAIVFALGILGLLSVMALGFASTALLNNSISKNVMNDAYARTLARNLALTQAVYLINDKAGEAERGFVDYRKIYTYGTESSNEVKDFLWKLDFTLTGKNSGRTATRMVKFYAYTPGDTDGNPANNVRWQYVKDSAQEKILGRYAYVVVPEKGGLCPSYNLETAGPIPSKLTTTNIKTLEKYISLGASTKGDLAVASPRWMSYGELISKCKWSSTTSYNNMFKHWGYTPALAMSAPEAYWEDGKLYSRFNLNRTDWNTMTPKKLCGLEGTTTLAEFPAKQEFIPWLKQMSATNEDQALQIAANIIQYNRAYNDSQNSVSDITTDWMTTAPKYIGIGRHPMLNELGFLVHIKPLVTRGVTPVNGPTDDGQVTYEYTPEFHVMLDCGAELIFPFRPPASGFKTAEVSMTGDMEISLFKFNQAELQSNLSTYIADSQPADSTPVADPENVVLKASLNSNSAVLPTLTGGDGIELFPGVGYAATGFKLSFGTDDWNMSPAYTKAATFWKRDQGGEGKKTQRFVVKLPVIQLTTNVSQGDISEKLARLMQVKSIKIAPEKILLKYGPNESEPSKNKQRDFVKTLPVFNVSSFAKNFTTISDLSSGYAWSVAYEATDPLVNLEEGDWTMSESTTEHEWNIESFPVASDTPYPGSVYDGTEEKHVNTTLRSDKRTAEINSLLKKLGYISADSDSFDPAFHESGDYYRLSTGIIRHGQMLSFWELGCISRGKAFEPLNLLAKDNDPVGAPDGEKFSFNRGDAVLFDQLKLSDNDYTAGKINVNANRHKVLEQLFAITYTSSTKTYKWGFMRQSTDDSKVSAFAYRQNSLKPHDDEYSLENTDKILMSGTPAEDQVQVAYQAPPAADSSTTSAASTTKYPTEVTGHSLDTCVVCSLLKATEQYCLQNRGDLLLPYEKLPAEGGTCASKTDWEALQGLLQPGTTYMDKIQVAGKIMPILRAEPADVLYVVILAQSIKDMGGNVIVTKDWNGTGIETAVPSSNNTAKYRAYYMAGFRRSISSTTISGLTEPPRSGTDDGTPRLIKIYSKNEFGKYDLGSDKITGEARLVATLVRDPETGKWKLLRVQNVE